LTDINRLRLNDAKLYKPSFISSEVVVEKRGIGLLKRSAEKIAGPVVLAQTAIGMVGDYNAYEGNDRYKAMGLTLGGTVPLGL
jgi:hypothetical protein